MTAAKCDVCGRFRRWADVVSFDAGDTHVEEVVTECKACTAPSNLPQVQS